MENLKRYNTWDEVVYKPEEMELVGSRWVLHRSESFDGQKQKVKGRIVAKGFHEIQKPPADSPTISREALLIQTAIAANQDFNIWTVDIKGDYLQSDTLERIIYILPPPDQMKTDEKGEKIIWKLNKPM